MSRDSLIAQLRGYESLAPGWNSYGGQPPSAQAIHDCIGFLESLDAARMLPKPMVGGDGEVGFFWETDDLYVEVGFKGDGNCDYLVSFKGSDTEGSAALGRVPLEVLGRIPCA